MMSFARRYFFTCTMGVVLLYIDSRLFLFYAFVAYLYELHRYSDRREERFDQLDRIVRVNNMVETVQVAAIADKLGITEDDLILTYGGLVKGLPEDVVRKFEDELNSMVGPKFYFRFRHG